MPTHPTGSVTFLFTDIEGSTRIAQENPDQWASLELRHHTILREAIETNGGYVFHIIGDAFCAAFQTPLAAIRAAVRTQQTLGAEDWGASPIKVRVGIHTGPAEIQTDGDYAGYLTLSRVQRLMAAGSGGQVLISGASCELVRERLPKNVSLQDLGKHRLKDLAQPEHIFQVAAPGLAGGFRALKTMSSLLNNLPSQLTPFVGREDEIHTILGLLRSPHKRLVTLTGAGGSGKTRLSLEVGAELLNEFEHGVWFVELAPLADPALVLQSIAAKFGVHEKSGDTLNRLLIEYLNPRQTLLLVDNCEHLIEPCALILAELLQNCPDLKVLATSREMLGISGEIVWTVPPLSMPEIQPWKNTASAQDALHSYQQSEAVRLFVTRAAANSPDFQLSAENGVWIAETCRRLDGMPLAIELAAARVRSLSVQQIAQKLDDRFHLLTGGSRMAPLRQQTLEYTIDWSYALLSLPEQKVLQKLAVFAGSANLDAVEFVCTGDGVDQREVMDIVSQLVNKSLVIAIQRSGEMRYSQLETIRQYASQKSQDSEVFETARDRYLAYYAQWIEIIESNRQEGDYVSWLARYETENDNLRGALGWSLTSEDRLELGLRLATCFGWFLHARGDFSEGRAQIIAVLNKTKPGDRSIKRAKLLQLAGALAFLQTDYPATRLFSEECISIYRELGAEGRRGLASELLNLGDMSRQVGDYERSFSLLDEGLHLMQELNDPHGLIAAYWQLGYYEVSRGNYQQAEPYFSEALLLSREKGDGFSLDVILSGLAECALRQGNYDRAAVFEEESLLIRKAGDVKWGIAISLANFAWIAINQGDLEKAGTLLLESLALRREIEERGGMAWCLEKLAKIDILYGQRKPGPHALDYYRHAAQLYGAAAVLRAPVGSVIDEADQADYNHDLEWLRKELGSEVFSKLWFAAETMPLEAVIDGVLIGSAPMSTQDENQKPGGLTAREREVVVLIAQGKSNREIAKAMIVGQKTVETYVTRILNKLGFDSRVQIATWAIEKHIVAPGKS